ncbi:MAG: DNA adenine methylase [Deltaproteobacteria bacterium]|nr:DNA adenine methylase [Deltaproteobacteria bacterium]NND28667.1 DNA adenine methylase [Myxococcales bacterium]MBT8466493.1 DNA adenine methylase [Deltaproteobacteria bacterium]MBT8481867.1 DNA adenine methylase [Deltaproteobacteria bacterium]NNK09551.1 DNA adenine methylase [Myxococcales bacterium]
MTTSAAVAARVEHEPREAAPFVKWVGGKGRLLSQLRPLLPPGVEQMRHVEPFVGGGALFFSRVPRRALLTDINPTLISTYTAIRDDVKSVIGGLRRLANQHSKERYYEVRARYNQERRIGTSKRAAMFIYLNKTCFNGLHRVNRKGEFNVPAGSYKSPRILNEAALQSASKALQGADLRCTSFDALLESAKPGDFIYFDPPYAPVSVTANFTSYAQDGFSQDDQTRLRDVYRALDRRGCKLMLSNSDVPFIRDLYGKFKVDTVAAPRAINCDATKRGKVREVVVRNYV